MLKCTNLIFMVDFLVLHTWSLSPGPQASLASTLSTLRSPLSIPKLHLKQTQIYKHFFSVFWPLFFVWCRIQFDQDLCRWGRWEWLICLLRRCPCLDGFVGCFPLYRSSLIVSKVSLVCEVPPLPMPTGKAIHTIFIPALRLKNKELQCSNPRILEKSTTDLPYPVL